MEEGHEGAGWCAHPFGAGEGLGGAGLGDGAYLLLDDRDDDGQRVHQGAALEGQDGGIDALRDTGGCVYRGHVGTHESQLLASNNTFREQPREDECRGQAGHLLRLTDAREACRGRTLLFCIGHQLTCVAEQQGGVGGTLWEEQLELEVRSTCLHRRK